MDGDDRRASQYGQPYQNPGRLRPAAGQPMGPPTTDRYSQPSTPVRSDAGQPSMARPFVPGYGYGYQEQQYASSSLHSSSPMQGVEMQYSPAYVQEVSRQQQMGQPQPRQQYASYAQGSMLPPAAPQQMYEAMPQYQQRQSAAIEVMTSQLGAMPQYMPQGGQSGLALQPGASQYMSSQAEQSTYPSIAVTRPGMQHYGSVTPEYAMIEPSSTVPTAAEQTALEEGMRNYEQQLRRTFEDIVAGRLAEAGEKLLNLSRWLTGSVVDLGLHHDDEAKHDERLDLWRQFNLCWEALGQKQKDMTEEALRTRRQPVNILSANTLQTMVDELLSMCDQLEQYGLVDYEMGIAEEQITYLFALCLELLPQEAAGQQPHGQTLSS